MADARWSILTPTGAAGAIAVFQIEGDIGGALTAAGLGRLNAGEVKLRSLMGVDEGLAARWDERTLQLMPHGGAEVQRALAARLTEAGISPASPDSLPHYPEACDRIEALMLHALARAASPMAIDLLLDQPRRWREAGRAAGAEGNTPRPGLHVLDRLINPALVVALGPTNIGKSTLVNALAGRAVSIVADEPGTTRDHVGVTLDLAGLVVRYADTPGLRAHAGEVERTAADIALDLARRADLVLLCGDAEHEPPNLPGLGDRLRIALRTDRGTPAWPFDAAVCVPRSQGLPELVATIRGRLVPSTALTEHTPWPFWQALGLEFDDTNRRRGVRPFRAGQ